MTQEEIIEMARKAGGIDLTNTRANVTIWIGTGTSDFLDAFAKLVAEHEREACIAHAMTSAEKAIDVAIKLEREACAEICDGFYLTWINTQGRYEFMGEGASECAGAIRRRGQA